MKSPSCVCPTGCACKRRPRLPAVKAADGRVHKAAAYRPQFALGILCCDEAEQQALHRRLSRTLRGREIKVLVI